MAFTIPAALFAQWGRVTRLSFSFWFVPVLLIGAVHCWVLIRAYKNPWDTLRAVLLLYLTALPLVNLCGVSPNLESARFYYLPSVVFYLWLSRCLISSRKWVVHLALVYCISSASLLYVHNLPWREAGKLTQKIVGRASELPPGPKRFDSVPDNYRGAFVFRNGLDWALRIFNDDDAFTCWRTNERDASWKGLCTSGQPVFKWNGERFVPVERGSLSQ